MISLGMPYRRIGMAVRLCHVLCPIRKLQPKLGKPVKTAYMWRDIERRAALYGVPVRVPVPYPLSEMELANRVAILAAKEGWCSDYVIATYRRWFQNGLEPGAEPNLSDSLREVGRNPLRVIAEAKSDDIGNALLAANDAARSLSIFGSPSFVVSREVFWGDDRLEDALKWCRFGSLGRTV